MNTTLLQVALGGAAGALARHGAQMLALRLTSAGFPVGTLGVNVLGSFLIGLAWVWLSREGAPRLSPLLVTGFLGGFTTFSAFSLDALRLWERGEAMAALAYVVASVALSLAAVAAGVSLARGVAA
jgi:CrcB protein